MTIMCNQCANPLKGSEYYEITCRDIKSADDHDTEERVKEIEQESNQHNVKKKERQ